MSITSERSNNLVNAMNYDFGDSLPCNNKFNGDLNKKDNTLEYSQRRANLNIIHTKPDFLSDASWVAYQKMFPWLYYSGSRFLCYFCEEGFQMNQGMVSTNWTGGNSNKAITEPVKGYSISRTRFERHSHTHNHILASELLLQSPLKDDWSNLKLKYLWLEGDVNETRCTICEDAYKKHKQSMIVTVWTCPDFRNHKSQSHFSTAHRLDRHEKCKNHQLALKLKEDTVSNMLPVNESGSPTKISSNVTCFTPNKSNHYPNIRNSSVTRSLSRHSRPARLANSFSPHPTELTPVIIRRSRKSAPVKSCKQSEAVLPRALTPQQFHNLKSRYPWLACLDETSFACEICRVQEAHITFSGDASMSLISKKIMSHVHINGHEDRHGRTTRLQMGVSPKIDYKRLSTGIENVPHEKTEAGSWSCPQCKSQFVHKAGLVAHISLCDYQSTDIVREMSCPCGSVEHRFHTITKLDLHAAQDHSNQPLFHCYICSDRCTRLLTLFEHMTIHHLLDWDPFDTYVPIIHPSLSTECAFCKSSFTTNLELTKHYFHSKCNNYLQINVMVEDVYKFGENFLINYPSSSENNITLNKIQLPGNLPRKRNSRTTFSQKMSKINAKRLSKKAKEGSSTKCLKLKDTLNETYLPECCKEEVTVQKVNETDNVPSTLDGIVNNKLDDIYSSEISLEKCTKKETPDTNAMLQEVQGSSEGRHFGYIGSAEETEKDSFDNINIKNQAEIKDIDSQNDLEIYIKEQNDNSIQKCNNRGAETLSEDNDKIRQMSLQKHTAITTENDEKLGDDFDEKTIEPFGKHAIIAPNESETSLDNLGHINQDSPKSEMHIICSDKKLSNCEKSEDELCTKKRKSTELKSKDFEISTESHMNVLDLSIEDHLNEESKKNSTASDNLEISLNDDGTGISGEEFGDKITRNKHVSVVLEKLSELALPSTLSADIKKRKRMPSEKLRENADSVALSLENKKRIRLPSDKLKESRESVVLYPENTKRVKFPSLKMRKDINESLDHRKSSLSPLGKTKGSADATEKKVSKKRATQENISLQDTKENAAMCKDKESSSVHRKNSQSHERKRHKNEKVAIRIKNVHSPHKETRVYAQKINQAMKRSQKLASRMKKSVCSSNRDEKEDNALKTDAKCVKIKIKSEESDNDTAGAPASVHGTKKPKHLTIRVMDTEQPNQLQQQSEMPKVKKPIIIQSQLSPPAKMLINFVPDDDCLPTAVSFMDRMKNIRQLKKIRTEQQREQMMAVDKTVAAIHDKSNGDSLLLKSEKIKKLLTSEQYSMHDLKTILHKESKKRKLSIHDGDQTAKKRKLSSHMTAKAEIFGCDVCHTKFRSLRARDTHILLDHKGAKLFKCRLCDVSRSTHFALRKHALKCHVDNASFAVFGDDTHTVDFSFQCHFCPLQFTSKSGMSHHVTSIHRADPDKQRASYEPATPPTEVDEFVDRLKQASAHHGPSDCPMCDDVMANGFELALHITEHEREKDCHIEANQFACPKCCRLFFGKEGKTYLKDHYNIIHLQKPLPSCDDCKAEFVSTWCYYEHKRSPKNCLKRPVEQLAIVDPYEPLNDVRKLAFVCSRCQTMVAGEGASDRFEEHNVACSQQLTLDESLGPTVDDMAK